MPVAVTALLHSSKKQFAVVKQEVSLRNSWISAAVLAIANMGDAFLYAWLPGNYQHAGIDLFWVGWILSVNRFARLFLNNLVAWQLSKSRLKTMMLIALITASISTISYGFILSIPLWIVARFLWGISFSTLRLGNTLYALQYHRKGMALGISRAVIEMGPVVALITGPILFRYAGTGNTFLVFGLINIVAIILSLKLAHLKTETVVKKDLLLSFPGSYSLLVLINSFITEGVLVVMTGRLIQSDQILTSAQSLTIVGFFLAYRRLSLVLFSPLSGLLADKYGFGKLFISTISLTVAGLIFMFTGFMFTGLLVVYTFSAMNASIATGVTINFNRSLIKEASDNATWRDLGAATGALTGAFMLTAVKMQPLIMVFLLMYGAGLVFHFRMENKLALPASILRKIRVYNKLKLYKMNLETIEILQKTTSRGVPKNDTSETGCCGGTPVNNEEACCKLDEEKKAQGESGCGCSSEPATNKSVCC